MKKSPDKKALAKKPAKRTAVKKPATKPSVKKVEKKEIWATGKRKTSIARVQFFSQGTGEISVNKRTVKDYFPIFELQKSVAAPLVLLKQDKKFKFSIKVHGGGIRGQAEAVRLGIARALVLFNPDWRRALKMAGYLRRDPRKKERKKPGLKRARRAPQWAKR